MRNAVVRNLDVVLGATGLAIAFGLFFIALLM
jgi:hypothetical protein